MRIWKVDGKEQNDIPRGITIARDMLATPMAPKNHPHKVEYIDTNHTTPAWILVCDHVRNFPQELATAIHAKQCHFNHVDGCSWDYESFAGSTPAGNNVRSKYLDKAYAMMVVIKGIYDTGCSDEDAYSIAIRILGTM